MTWSSVLVSETSNCSESWGRSFSVYPPTLVREPPLIWLIPQFKARLLTSSFSLVEIIIPVYGTEILMQAMILRNVSSLIPLSKTFGSMSSAFFTRGTEIVCGPTP